MTNTNLANKLKTWRFHKKDSCDAAGQLEVHEGRCECEKEIFKNIISITQSIKYLNIE